MASKRGSSCISENNFYSACVDHDFNMAKYSLNNMNKDTCMNGIILNTGETTITLALKLNFFKIVKYLVEEKQANLDATNAYRDRPIIIAYINNDVEMVEYFESYGSELTVPELYKCEDYLNSDDVDVDEKLESDGAKYCSMGMSGDFELAIKCGSNMVRVGSSIFKR